MFIIETGESELQCIVIGTWLLNISVQKQMSEIREE